MLRLIIFLLLITSTLSLTIYNKTYNTPHISSELLMNDYLLGYIGSDISMCNKTYIPNIGGTVFVTSNYCSCKEKIYNAIIGGIDALIIITDSKLGKYAYYCYGNYSIDVYEISYKVMENILIPDIIYKDDNNTNEYKVYITSMLYITLLYFVLSLSLTQTIYSIYETFKPIRLSPLTFTSSSASYRILFMIIHLISSISMILICIRNILIYFGYNHQLNMVINYSIPLTFTILSSMIMVISWTKDILHKYNSGRVVIGITMMMSSGCGTYIFINMYEIITYYIYYIDIPYINVVNLIIITVSSMYIIIAIFYISSHHNIDKYSVLLCTSYIILLSIFYVQMFQWYYIMSYQLTSTIIIFINFMNIKMINEENFSDYCVI